MSAVLELTVQHRRIVDALRPFLGDHTDVLYEANGRSLRQLAYFARDSALPCCERLVSGLALAQQLLAEERTLYPKELPEIPDRGHRRGMAAARSGSSVPAKACRRRLIISVYASAASSRRS